MHSAILAIVAIIAILVLVVGLKEESYESSSSSLDNVQKAYVGVKLAWSMYAETYAKSLDPAGKQQFQDLQNKLSPTVLGTWTESKKIFGALSAADKALLTGFYVKTIAALQTAQSKLTAQDTKMMLAVAKDVLSNIKVT